MAHLQQDIENFLIAEAGVGLANVCAHLEWASSSAGEDVYISREGVAGIVANLRRIQFRADALSNRLVYGRTRRLGLEETLRDLARGAA